MSIFTINYNMLSDEESEEKLKCNKCKCIIDCAYNLCIICDELICIACMEKGIFMKITTSIFKGICYDCLKNNTNDNNYVNIIIPIREWRTLYKKYKTTKESKKSQTKYITELEAEIKLLKTMIDFQVGGDGYLAASENFKQLVDKNDTIDDNQYNDCDDHSNSNDN
jgi:hypothetical protein